MNSQPGLATRAALLGLSAAAMLGLAACGAAGATSAAAAPVAPTHHTVAPAATVPVVAPAPTSDKPATHHYRDARTQWRAGAGASSAMEGKYWLAAAADLKAADTPGYTPAITELRQLTALPDAEQTPAQNAEFHHDINTLNTFFGTPGLYS